MANIAVSVNDNVNVNVKDTYRSFAHLSISEDELRMAQEIEEDNDYSDAMESMERKYWEGYTDALGALYSLTYQLSFAIAEREEHD